MNRFKVILLVLIGVILLAGCVATSFHKKVIVEKDGTGKIIKTTVTEELIQPNRAEEPMPGKYLNE